MPTLNWLNREAAFRTAQAVPTRVLRPHAAGHRFGDADGAPGQVGRLWAERSRQRAVFALVFRNERGMAVNQQIDAALA